jgi:hypothetical protein
MSIPLSNNGKAQQPHALGETNLRKILKHSDEKAVLHFNGKQFYIDERGPFQRKYDELTEIIAKKWAAKFKKEHIPKSVILENHQKEAGNAVSEIIDGLYCKAKREIYKREDKKNEDKRLYPSDDKFFNELICKDPGRNNIYTIKDVNVNYHKMLQHVNIQYSLSKTQAHNIKEEEELEKIKDNLKSAKNKIYPTHNEIKEAIKELNQANKAIISHSNEITAIHTLHPEHVSSTKPNRKNSGNKINKSKFESGSKEIISKARIKLGSAAKKIKDKMRNNKTDKCTIDAQTLPLLTGNDNAQTTNLSTASVSTEEPKVAATRKLIVASEAYTKAEEHLKHANSRLIEIGKELHEELRNAYAEYKKFKKEFVSKSVQYNKLLKPYLEKVNTHAKDNDIRLPHGAWEYLLNVNALEEDGFEQEIEGLVKTEKNLLMPVLSDEQRKTHEANEINKLFNDPKLAFLKLEEHFNHAKAVDAFIKFNIRTGNIIIDAEIKRKIDKAAIVEYQRSLNRKNNSKSNLVNQNVNGINDYKKQKNELRKYFNSEIAKMLSNSSQLSVDT